MEREDTVSVIILNWNGKKFLRDCLKAVLSQTYRYIETIVVDNGSTDGSEEIVKKEFPQVKLIRNKDNQGFARGVNQGIDVSSGNFILPLNTDVVFTPTFVATLVEAAKVNEKVGAVSGKLLKPEKKQGKRIIDSTGHVIFKNRLTYDRGDGEIDKGQYESEEYMFGVCAAAAIYKREMLEDVKLDGEYFDESFFAFLEDIDLGWRAQLRDWKCFYTPKAVAYHYRGGTAARRSKLVEIHNYKNRYLMVIKNDSFLSVLKNLHHFFLTDLVKSGALLFRYPTALLGWLYVIKLLPSAFRKRSIIQSKRKVSQKEMDKWFQRFSYLDWIKYNFRKNNRL